MDVNNQPPVDLQTDPSRSSLTQSRLSKNDQKWNCLKEEIHRLYVDEKKTLPETMQIIQERHGFKASLRKWKMKLKDWGYDKYLSTTEMQIVIAKAEKRAREEGKETVFFHGESQITTKRIENFKKRKLTKELDVASPSAETPANITYHTPRPGNENYPLEDLTFTTQHDNHYLSDLASLELDPRSLTSIDDISPYVPSTFLASEDPNYVLAQEGAPFDAGADMSSMSSEWISRSEMRTINKISSVSYQGPSTSVIENPMAHPDAPSNEIGISTAKKHQFSSRELGFLKWRNAPGFPVAMKLAGSLNNSQSVLSISNISKNIDHSAEDVTLAEASRAFALGRSHQATGNLNEAVSEFSRAIALFTQGKDKHSLKILEALASVTDIYRNQDLIPEYISACEQLRAWKKQIFGEISPGSLQSTFELAKVFLEAAMCFEAESLFREALAGFEKLRMNEQHLHCRRFLGESLRYQACYAEAESHFVSVLACCLQRGSKDLMVIMLKALENLYFEQGPSGLMLIERSSMALLLLTNQPSYLLDRRGRSPEKILLAIADLASGYSSLWRLELAQMLYMPLVIQLGRWRSHRKTDEAEQARAYHKYSAHCSRQGHPHDRTLILLT